MDGRFEIVGVSDEEFLFVGSLHRLDLDLVPCPPIVRSIVLVIIYFALVPSEIQDVPDVAGIVLDVDTTFAKIVLTTTSATFAYHGQGLLRGVYFPIHPSLTAAFRKRPEKFVKYKNLRANNVRS